MDAPDDLNQWSGGSASAVLLMPSRRATIKPGVKVGSHRRTSPLGGGSLFIFMNLNLNIDLGLAVASAVSPPGTQWSAQELAEVCGCSRKRIHQLERRALRKLRTALRREGINADALLGGIQTAGGDHYEVHGQTRI